MLYTYHVYNVLAGGKPMDLPKIDNTNLWDKTYALLKESIVRRHFGPNHKLSIPELSRQLGVSRTPVRDALNRLEMEGLVKTVSKVGTFVVAVTAEDVLDYMDTRLMLEYWVVDRLPEVSRPLLQRKLDNMEAILQQSAEIFADGGRDDYLKADYNLQFHIEFMELGQNQYNIDIYLQTMRYRFITMKSSIVSDEMVGAAQTQHRQILDALRDGQTDDLKRVIRLHLDDSKERLLKVIQENGGVI